MRSVATRRKWLVIKPVMGAYKRFEVSSRRFAPSALTFVDQTLGERRVGTMRIFGIWRVGNKVKWKKERTRLYTLMARRAKNAKGGEKKRVRTELFRTDQEEEKREIRNLILRTLLFWRLEEKSDVKRVEVGGREGNMSDRKTMVASDCKGEGWRGRNGKRLRGRHCKRWRTEEIASHV